MQNKHPLGGLLILCALLTAPGAQAHTLASEGALLWAGFSHPLLGWDHLLAMLAVGLWATQQSARSGWGLPVVFLGMMSISAVLGWGGLELPLVEAGIASSLLVLGLLLACATRLPMVASMAIVGLFAVFHGYAHGAEMPQAASALLYGLGFMLATAGLSMLGMALGCLFRGTLGASLLRIGGGAMAATSVLLWV